MQKSAPKTLKRQKPQKSQSKSKEKQTQSSKKRKLSYSKEETKQQKINSKQSIQPQCFICAQPYNLNRKLPVVACPNNHTFCFNCITSSLKALKPNCPMCRSLMEPNHLNSMIYDDVIFSYRQKNKHLDKGIIQKKLTKLSMKKFSKQHSSLEDIQIVPRVGKFIKMKNNNSPSLLVFEPEIKQKTIVSYHFNYYPFNKAQISFGVCIYDKFLLKMVQNCGFDTKIIDFFMTKRESFIKIDPKKGLRILVNVDLQKNEIHWFSQRQSPKDKNKDDLYLISSQPIQISKKVGDLAYYPYIVLFNNGDTVQINK